MKSRARRLSTLVPGVASMFSRLHGRSAQKVWSDNNDRCPLQLQLTALQGCLLGLI